MSITATSNSEFPEPFPLTYPVGDGRYRRQRVRAPRFCASDAYDVPARARSTRMSGLGVAEGECIDRAMQAAGSVENGGHGAGVPA